MLRSIQKNIPNEDSVGNETIETEDQYVWWLTTGSSNSSTDFTITCQLVMDDHAFRGITWLLNTQQQFIFDRINLSARKKVKFDNSIVSKNVEL